MQILIAQEIKLGGKMKKQEIGMLDESRWRRDGAPSQQKGLIALPSSGRHLNVKGSQQNPHKYASITNSTARRTECQKSLTAP
jgi:hypothetical protein